MAEIEMLLADFEIAHKDFVDHVIDLEEWNGDEQKHQLERGNLYQYFRNARPVPLSKLWRIVDYLNDYQAEITDSQQREAFVERVNNLAERVVAYIEKQINTPMQFRKVVRETLRTMEDQEIRTLFNSLHIFSVPTNVWNFWGCYCCLNSEAQKEIRNLLSAYPLPPIAYGVNFYWYRLWEKETNRPACVKFEKCWKRYRETLKEGKETERKKFIDEVAHLLYKYPYSFPNVVQNFYQRAIAPAQMTEDDWSIIIAYGLLQSAVRFESEVTEIVIDHEKVAVDGELLKIGQAILTLLSDETNWCRNFNDNGKYTAIPRKFVDYYMKAFRESSTMDCSWCHD